MIARTITTSDDLAKRICEAVGLDPNLVNRLIVDLAVGEPITIYVKQFGGQDELISVDFGVLKEAA